jgi:hypothetical protein
VFLVQARILELALISLYEIEVDLGTEVGVSGRLLIEKQQRISNVDCIGNEDFLEQFGSIRELRLEFRPDLGSNGVTAFSNARPDCGPQVAGIAAEVAAHFSNAFSNDAGDCPTPAGMECANRPKFRIDNQHGHAVSRFDRKQNAGEGRDHAVPCKRLLSHAVNSMNYRRMDLPDLHQWPGSFVGIERTDRSHKEPAISFHVLAGVVIRGSEIERFAAIAGRSAALARTEAVNEPRDFFEHISMQDFGCGSCG